ncbi:MAG: hypothetical protein N2508_14915, partial [Anaerolineae bacterium]|nr:hypothetical protein [Anaerolineae bacterium]
GVGAALPTSLLIVYVSRRRDEQRVSAGGQGVAGVYPPGGGGAPPGGQHGFSSLAERGAAYPQHWPVQRHFTVVGGTSGERDMPY